VKCTKDIWFQWGIGWTGRRIVCKGIQVVYHAMFVARRAQWNEDLWTSRRVWASIVSLIRLPARTPHVEVVEFLRLVRDLAVLPGVRPRRNGGTKKGLINIRSHLYHRNHFQFGLPVACNMTLNRSNQDLGVLKFLENYRERHLWTKEGQEGVCLLTFFH
jgi:hypothetical protein